MMNLLSNSVFKFSRTTNISKLSPLVRQYHENIIDHYENPRNVGRLNKDSKNVGTGIVIIFFFLHFFLFIIIYLY
jgi:hypothetical protein